MNEKDNKRLGELIFLLARGNISVLSEIYLLMYNILYAVGNVYLNQKADIEDEIGNLLLLLYEKASKFKKNKNACAWVIRVYQNLIINHLKNKMREKSYIYDRTQSLKIISQSHDLYVENHIFISNIFGKLNEYEKNLIIYRFWCKCSIREVADIVGSPKSTVESQIYKLQNKIKNL